MDRKNFVQHILTPNCLREKKVLPWYRQLVCPFKIYVRIIKKPLYMKIALNTKFYIVIIKF